MTKIELKEKYGLDVNVILIDKTTETPLFIALGREGLVYCVYLDSSSENTQTMCPYPEAVIKEYIFRGYVITKFKSIGFCF